MPRKLNTQQRHFLRRLNALRGPVVQGRGQRRQSDLQDGTLFLLLLLCCLVVHRHCACVHRLMLLFDHGALDVLAIQTSNSPRLVRSPCLPAFPFRSDSPVTLAIEKCQRARVTADVTLATPISASGGVTLLAGTAAHRQATVKTIGRSKRRPQAITLALLG